MATFPTPEPIQMTFELVGDVRIEASDRDDTVVAVRPNNPTKAADVRAAEQTIVECRDGRLLVKMPRSWRHYTPFGGNAAVEVTVELPTGSSISGDSAIGHVFAEGELGECQIKTTLGDIRVHRTGPLRAKSGLGTVTVDHVRGDAELTTGSGVVRAGTIVGDAVIKNSNGATTIGTVTGDLRVKASNGDISVRRAQASATAKTAMGDVRIDEVRRGTVVLETATGGVQVGIRQGTAAWLDASTQFGHVHNSLDDAAGPPATGDRVEVRARTTMGDVVIGRAPQDDDEPDPTTDTATSDTATTDERSDPS